MSGGPTGLVASVRNKTNVRRDQRSELGAAVTCIGEALGSSQGAMMPKSDLGVIMLGVMSARPGRNIATRGVKRRFRIGLLAIRLS
jgi:hypothetical protein